MPRVFWYLIFFIDLIVLIGAGALFFLIHPMQGYEATQMTISPTLWYMVLVMPATLVLGMILVRWFRPMIVLGILAVLLGGTGLYLTRYVYVEKHETRIVVLNAFGIPDVNDFGEVRFEDNPQATLYDQRCFVRYVLAGSVTLTGIGLLIGGLFGRSLVSPLEDIPKEYRELHRRM